MDSAGAKSSSSCPPIFQGQRDPPNNMSEEQARLWQKDRQKKDNHNMSKHYAIVPLLYNYREQDGRVVIKTPAFRKHSLGTPRHEAAA